MQSKRSRNNDLHVCLTAENKKHVIEMCEVKETTKSNLMNQMIEEEYKRWTKERSDNK